MQKNLSMPRLVIAATHSGAGKTTVTLAIMAAMLRKGLRVQAFKTGPDFIDPSHHSALTGRPSRNLDTWMIPEPALLEIFADATEGTDIAIVEGVMGLFDGLAGTEEAGSTAHLAKLLRAPVVLVVDAKGMARSAAAMIKGYLEFDKDLNFAGVIFNNVGSPNHFDFLKSAVEHELSLPVLGYLARNAQATIPERHLGLVPSQEQKSPDQIFAALAQMAMQSINLDLLFAKARQAPDLTIPKGPLADRGKKRSSKRPRIAVAWDKAFHFYYQDNLRLLTLAGAELVFFSPLVDKRLPGDIDMIYIGGGFPEIHAQTLSNNKELRAQIKDFMLGSKKPVYAECGGLMYLCSAIRDFNGKPFAMVGAIPAQAIMGKKRSALGYVQAEVVKDNLLSRQGQTLRGHEFHWSYLEQQPGFEKLSFAYSVTSRLGQSKKPDGIIVENSLISYTHLHFSHAPDLVDRLMGQI